MKNHRATMVVAALGIGLVVGVGLVLQWYRSGAAPEPPASFFDPRDVQRAIARLESHRLDQTDRLQLCRAITNHLAGARALSFTNPTTTRDAVDALKKDLASIPASADGDWRPAVDAFTETSTNAYRDAGELVEILEQTDWSGLSVPLLESRIVRAKELVAALQKFPPWQSNEALRTMLYPAFEQAYRHRREQDYRILRNKLLSPGPALTRWYYARLLEDRSGLAPSLCSTTLEKQKLALLQTQDDLQRADGQSILQSWSFPAARADYLTQLIDIVRALEQSTTLRDWLAAAELKSDALHQLVQQTRSGASRPDPRVRIAADQLQAVIHDVGRMMETFLSVPNLDSLGLLVQSLGHLPTAHPDLAKCLLSPLSSSRDIGAETLQSARAWVAQPHSVREGLADLKRTARDLSGALGRDVTEPILADTLDQWCDHHWPPVAELGQIAALFRRLSDESSLHTPSLSGVTDLLEDIAATETEDQRARLLPDWETRVRPRLADYPALVRRIDHLFGMPVRSTSRDVQRSLLDALDQANHSFQQMRQVVDARLRPPLPPEMEAFATVLRAAIERLGAIVDRDRRAGTPGEVSEIATDYSALSNDSTVPAPLAAYARAQARSLLSYTLPSDYSFQWQPDSGKQFSVAYDQLGTAIDALGHGRRLKGRGENLQLWIRTREPRIAILRGDWKDDPASGRIQVSDLEAIPNSHTWQWGTPVEVGIRVAHTTNPDKDLVPDGDSTRSRWNPLNYGVYRVETQEYVVATFSSLEHLVRAQLFLTNDPPHVVLDDIMDPNRTEAKTLRFAVDGIPPGRDFDWPVAVEPQTIGELYQLRRDVESAVSNLVDDVLLTP